MYTRVTDFTTDLLS